MAIRAYAIMNDMGVLIRDEQLLIFARKAYAERTLAWLLNNEGAESDWRVIRVEIHPTHKKGRAT